MPDVVEIYDARDEPEALLLSQKLREAGIEAWIAGESLGAVHGGGFTGPMSQVTVVVSSSDAQRARCEIDQWNPRDTVSDEDKHRPSAPVLVVTLCLVATALVLIFLLTKGQLQTILLALLFWTAAMVAAAIGVWRRRQ